MLVLSAPAAQIRFALTNSLTGLPDTNSFLVWKVGDPILANGGVQTIGVPLRYRPDTNGIVLTNMLAPGNYLATNAALGRGIVFRCFTDNSATVWNVFEAPPTGLAISGYNTFNTGFFTADAIEWLATNSFNGNLITASNFLYAFASTNSSASLTAAQVATQIAASNLVANATLLTESNALRAYTITVAGYGTNNVNSASNSALNTLIAATNASLAAANAYALVVGGYGSNNVQAAALRLTNGVMSASNNLATARITAIAAATNVSLATANAYTLTVAGYGTNNVLAAGLRSTNNVISASNSLATASTTALTAATNVSLATANAYTLTVAGYGTNNVLATAIRLTNDVMSASNNLATASTTALAAATNVSLATANAYTLTVAGYGTNNVQAAALRLTNNVMSASNSLATASTANLATANAYTLIVAGYGSNNVAATVVAATNQFPLSSLKTMPLTNSEAREVTFKSNLSVENNTYFGAGSDYVFESGDFSLGLGSVMGGPSGVVTASGFNSLGDLTAAEDVIYSGQLIGSLGGITNLWRSDIATTNAALTRQKLDATNGTAYALTVGTNLNFSPGYSTIRMITNIVGVTDFAQPHVNGTYVLQTSGTLTNNLNVTNSLFQTGGSWYLQSNGVSLFALSGNHPVGNSWTLVNGTGTIGQTVYGVRFNVNGWVMEGTLTSTNLDARIRAQIGGQAVTNGDTRAITLGNTNNVFYGTFTGASTSTATNAQYLLGVYGTAYMQTNTTLYVTQIRTNGALPNYIIGFDGSTVAWVTNAGGGGSFSGTATTLSTGLTNWVNDQASAYSLNATNGLRSDLITQLTAATNVSLATANAYTLTVGGYGSNNVIAATGRSTNMTMSASNTLYTAFKAGTNVLAGMISASGVATMDGNGTNTTLVNAISIAATNAAIFTNVVNQQYVTNIYFVGTNESQITLFSNPTWSIFPTAFTADPIFNNGGVPVFAIRNFAGGGFRIGIDSVVKSAGAHFSGFMAADQAVRGGELYLTNSTIQSVSNNPIQMTPSVIVDGAIGGESVNASTYYLNGIQMFSNTPTAISFYVTNGADAGTNFNGIYLYAGQGDFPYIAYTNTIRPGYYFHNSPGWNYLGTNAPTGAQAYSRLSTALGYYAAQTGWPTNEPLVSIYSAGGGTDYTGTFTGNGAGLTNIQIMTNTVYFYTNTATRTDVAAALARPNTRLFFYAGNYYGLTNLSTTNGTWVEGEGERTVFYMGPAQGYVFETGTNTTLGGYRNFVLDGGESATAWYNNPKGVVAPFQGTKIYPNLLLFNTYWSNRTGLKIAVNAGGTVENVTARGFSGYGIFAYSIWDSLAYQHIQTTFKGIKVHNNYFGFYPAQFDYDTLTVGTFLSPHYMQVMGWQAFNNTFGIAAAAANCIVADCVITANWCGVWLGCGGGIRGHGIIQNNTINHNTAYAIYGLQLDTGMLIANNYMFGAGAGQTNACYFDNSRQVSFYANTLANQTVTFTNILTSIPGYNFIYDNRHQGWTLRTNSVVSTNWAWPNINTSTGVMQ